MYFNGRKYVSVQEIITGAVPVEQELDEKSDNPAANCMVAKEIKMVNAAAEEQRAQIENVSGASVKLRALTAQRKNLYNHETALVGYIVNQATGLIQVDDKSENTVSYFIDVTPGTDYVLSYEKNDGTRAKHTTGYRYVFYDKNKEYITGARYNEAKFKYITAPENAAFVRISYYNASYFGRNVQLEEGTEPTEYEAFDTHAPAEVLAFKNAMLEDAANLDVAIAKVQDNAGHGQINEVLAVASGTVMFPAGEALVLDKPFYMVGRDNVILDFNGCTIIPSANFNAKSTMPGGLNSDILFGMVDCENVVVRNAVFDCNAVGRTSTMMGVESISSSVTFEDCTFKNSNYHHIWIKNGYCTGKDLVFLNLQDAHVEDADTSSDVFTECVDGGYVETHWRNIRAEREAMTGDKVFYFGVYNDTQKCYHTVDGLKAYNCYLTIELRGGEGCFRNIYAENVGCLISQVAKDVTEANAPIVTYENVHLKNIVDTQKSPVRILAARRARLSNVFIEAPNWHSNYWDDPEIGKWNRAIDLTPLSKHNYPIRDVVISDLKYVGVDLYCGVYIEGDVECAMDNITIDAATSNSGISAVNVPTPVKVSNFECTNMKVNLNNASLARRTYWNGSAWVEL